MSLLVVCDGCGRMFVDAEASADDVARDLRDACLQVGIETK